MSSARKPNSRSRPAESSGHKEHVVGASTPPTESRAVRFYHNEKALARIVAEFLREGLDRGDPGIVVATAALRAQILRELTRVAVDVDALQRSRELVLLDADEILSSFMRDGSPEPRNFDEAMARVVEKTSRRRADGPVRIFAQIVDVLWQRGEREPAIRLEALWSQLARTPGSPLLCAYAIGKVYKAFSAAAADTPRPIGSTGANAPEVAATAYDRSPRRRGRGHHR